MPPLTQAFKDAHQESNGRASPVPVISGEQRTERLAVNLYDLDRITPVLRASMLAGKLDLGAGAAQRVGEGRDEVIVPFCCPLLTAAGLCDVIRSGDRELGDPPTRVYLHRGRGWQRLPGHAVLTEVGEGGPRLAERWFPSPQEAVDATAPAPILANVGRAAVAKRGV